MIGETVCGDRSLPSDKLAGSVWCGGLESCALIKNCFLFKIVVFLI